MASMYFLVLIALCFGIYFNEEVKAECGRFIEATNGTITSPSFPYSYPRNQKCTWEIKIPPNKSIWLHFEYFDLKRSKNCTKDYVSLKSKMEDGSVQDHGYYCGTEIHGRSFQFNDSNKFLIEFTSDSKSEYVNGFKVDFVIVPFECGEMIEGSKGIITSPRFPLPYPPDLNCTWNIQAPLNHNIRLTFTDFKTEDSSECDQDQVIVQSKMADGETRSHGKFCGGKTPPVIFSESSILLIQFVSHTNKKHKGFKATFISEGCGGLMEGIRGNISTPFFPNLYPPNKMCDWIILVPPQHKINLYFLHFETEGGENCSNDFLQIQSRATDGKIQDYGKYCGNFKPPNIITSKNRLILKFVSDHRFNSTGFMAEYIIEELEPIDSTIENLQKEEIWILRNETQNLSGALTSLREEIASIKNTQKILLSNYEDLLKMSTLMTSDKFFPKDGGNSSSSSIERQLFNDCGKFLFFLRRMLDSEP